jgi:MSHA biogenesis protein MshE
MISRKKIRLGDLLVDNKLISDAQLKEALAEQKASGRKLGKILIENGYIKEDDMLQVLSKQLKIPFIDLLRYNFNNEIIKLIPEIQARRFRVVALAEDDQGILVGMADPTNIFAYDELSRLFTKPVNIAVVRESDLLKTIDIVYRKTDQISGFAEELSDELAESEIDFAAMLSSADVADAPVVKLLQSLFEDAMQIKASDIHIEPDEAVLRIRQRVDGVLQEHVMDEIRIVPSLVLRLKLMANLNISEKRMPQDGRFTVKIQDHVIDVRISTMPVQYGESVVMRLLDQTSGILVLNDLGMPVDVRNRFVNIIQRPHGMMLVTGPTGSGKTTTLYSALNLLNTAEKKIITVEDPVEYRLPRVSQVQVKTEIGLSFSLVLRSALRQDPDIILIGEMRDEETADIGIRAAMTGHMVLSTLHTNDAISTVIRLLDMGIKNYLLASSLHAILSQRLVRRICKSCSSEQSPDGQQLAWVKKHGDEKYASSVFYKGTGCPHCNTTGYQGRIGVYEFLELDQKLSELLATADSMEFTHAARTAAGFRTLSKVALEYAGEGVTTLDEVLRISSDVEVIADPAIEKPALGESA